MWHVFCRTRASSLVFSIRYIIQTNPDIYDDRLLVKIVPENEQYKMPKEIPYKNAKLMYFVEDIDSKEKLVEIIEATVIGLDSE